VRTVDPVRAVRDDRVVRIGATFVALAAAAVLAAAPGAATPFSPNAIAGTWKSQTFGSTGPAKIVAKSLLGTTKLGFTADFGGNAFGARIHRPRTATR
jgi:hypothetical protein